VGGKLKKGSLFVVFILMVLVSGCVPMPTQESMDCSKTVAKTVCEGNNLTFRYVDFINYQSKNPPIYCSVSARGELIEFHFNEQQRRACGLND
jgi:hypothetical protein